jgi:hypothetical protein
MKRRHRIPSLKSRLLRVRLLHRHPRPARRRRPRHNRDGTRDGTWDGTWDKSRDGTRDSNSLSSRRASDGAGQKYGWRKRLLRLARVPYPALPSFWDALEPMTTAGYPRAGASTWEKCVSPPSPMTTRPSDAHSQRLADKPPAPPTVSDWDWTRVEGFVPGARGPQKRRHATLTSG